MSQNPLIVALNIALKFKITKLHNLKDLDPLRGPGEHGVRHEGICLKSILESTCGFRV